MQTTGCSALLVDGGISHLHIEVLRKDSATGIGLTIIARSLVSSDLTRDGTRRALAFLAESETFLVEDLETEAKCGAFYLHTSGSTGTLLRGPPPSRSFVLPRSVWKIVGVQHGKITHSFTQVILKLSPGRMNFSSRSAQQTTVTGRGAMTTWSTHAFQCFMYVSAPLPNEAAGTDLPTTVLVNVLLSDSVRRLVGSAQYVLTPLVWASNHPQLNLAGCRSPSRSSLAREHPSSASIRGGPSPPTLSSGIFGRSNTARWMPRYPRVF